MDDAIRCIDIGLLDVCSIDLDPRRCHCRGQGTPLNRHDVAGLHVLRGETARYDMIGQHSFELCRIFKQRVVKLPAEIAESTMFFEGVIWPLLPCWLADVFFDCSIDVDLERIADKNLPANSARMRLRRTSMDRPCDACESRPIRNLHLS